MAAATKSSSEIALDIEVELPGQAASPPQPTLGRYELWGEIASGGMATVHLAVARGADGFGKALALKVIHPHLAREREFTEMFLDEARIASRIQHPNVASVLDFGKASGTYYLTMEYLMGEPLVRVAKALAKDGRRTFADVALTAEIAARIVAEACEGLHAAHELVDESGRSLEVVHRDVSPHNLFVGYDGTVKVVDFGVAKAEGRIHHSNTGMLKGKWAYMAPEQLRGQPVDRRADVWALGVVLWEVIAGRSLFGRRLESETVFAVTRGDVPKLSEVVPGAPPALDAILARALARRREDRYASARELGRALVRWLGGRSCAIDRTDLAELMRSLFPEQLETQRQVLARALAGPTGEASAPRGGPPTKRLRAIAASPGSGSKQARPAAKHSVVVARERGPARDDPAATVRIHRPRPSRTRDLLAFLAIAVTAAALTVGVWTLARMFGG